MPLAPIFNTLGNKGDHIFLRCVPSTMIPTSQQALGLDAVEEVAIAGDPNGIYDRKNLTPIWRRGITATPYQLDYDGEPVFLIDASVFPGSSGSPVFILNTGGYSAKAGGLVIGSRIHLLGVLAAVLFREDEGKLEFQAIPAGLIPMIRTREMIDLGLVYKGTAILDLVRHALHHFGIDLSQREE